MPNAPGDYGAPASPDDRPNDARLRRRVKGCLAIGRTEASRRPSGGAAATRRPSVVVDAGSAALEAAAVADEVATNLWAPDEDAK